MTISYNWLHEYLPVKIEPERLSRILTSIGLEVESLEYYESIKGGLKGLVIGEVLSRENHPNADKLSVTKVDVKQGAPLQVVCGAPNVAAGQKVVVALVGSTIYPKNSDPVTMKVAKIRGVESYGMICAEDEIGLSDDHAGILVLPDNVKVGAPAADYFKPFTDHIFEIGLTPNRMDAMSHLGVARDVCAYLSHHERKNYTVKSPFASDFKTDNNSYPIAVTIENIRACRRYSGISIINVTVKESPQWLQDKLRAIGQRPINNIVDITNFILHESGQPLHAFDADAIKGRRIVVKNLPAGSKFVTLDGKERTLYAEDLMICNAEEAIAIGGVFGGLHSGVSAATTNVFLESAWFNPVDIRKTSFRHGLRTEAATHFEKNIDISNTVNVLKRAALLVKELAGGKMASGIVDEYPEPENKPQVKLPWHYLRRLSGKNYHPDAVKNILTGLGFEMIREDVDAIWVAPPFSKPDIHLPADVVEEVMRIDGLDNIEIPSRITISPSVETDRMKSTCRNKTASYLVGAGFNEIFTNSITNSAYFSEQELSNSVRLLNNLSADHNVMRPSMLQTGLEAVAYNLNRKNHDLRFFEFGKTYSMNGPGKYDEQEHLCIYITGLVTEDSWKGKGLPSDLFYLKGVVARILQLTGIELKSWQRAASTMLTDSLEIVAGNNKTVVRLGAVPAMELKRFDIKQPVYFADFDWGLMLSLVWQEDLKVAELPKQLPVRRDLAMIVPKSLPYADVESTVQKVKLDKLQDIQLFDIFESGKLGPDKKSLALSFTFLDRDKTPTDKEIDSMMNKIMTALEKELKAEIRK